LAVGCDRNREKSQLRSRGLKQNEIELGIYTYHLKLDEYEDLFYASISVGIATGWYMMGEFRTTCKKVAGLIEMTMKKFATENLSQDIR
jgi:hypothetical protein